MELPVTSYSENNSVCKDATIRIWEKQAEQKSMVNWSSAKLYNTKQMYIFQMMKYW
jgi:hypothetical protein